MLWLLQSADAESSGCSRALNSARKCEGSQRRVDPGGCVMRQLSTINHRIYRVNGPLALWHIDGNYKLIKYGRKNCILYLVNVLKTGGSLLYMVALMVTAVL